MSHQQPKNIFTRGAIPASFIAERIQKHSGQTTIGAHSLFLGQVRRDVIDNKSIAAIDYTAHEEMALAQMHIITEAIFAKYSLTCMHVHHSLGSVSAGELCLLVFTSAPHRKAAISACEEIVERIKKELPIWGKEVFEDETYQWKVNQ
ncbi:MAG: molybdenum cofactor biosynthesis protein MoaE [Chitinophagaceae bacterium]